MVSRLSWLPSLPPPHLITTDPPPPPPPPSSSPSSSSRIRPCNSFSICSELDRRPLFRAGRPLILTSYNSPRNLQKRPRDTDISLDLAFDDDEDDVIDDVVEGTYRDFAAVNGCSDASHVAIATALDPNEDILWNKLSSSALRACGDVVVDDYDEETRDFTQERVLSDASHVSIAAELAEEVPRKRLEKQSSSIKPFQRYAFARTSDDLPSHEESSCKVELCENHGSSRKAFNRYDFARTFDVVALRVPLDEWRNISYGIKGHLLNWKGVDNMVRVDGDDLDIEIKSLLKDDKGKKTLDVEDSLLRAVYGTTAPPSRIEKQLRTVDKIRSRDYENLERISRPDRKVVKELRKEREKNPMVFHKNKSYMVKEMVPKVNSDESLQNVSLNVKKWVGPSRLLLLDINYARKPIQALPTVVQVLLNERVGRSSSRRKREIVPCKLTLFYEYWSMQEILKELLPEGEFTTPTIKIVGHMAQLCLGEQYSHLKHIIGKVILDKYRPKVKTVINKREITIHSCQSKLEVLAGNHSVATVIIEGGIRFHMNLATVSWNPELAIEAGQLIKKFNEKDIVCDVAAGVGALALASAKKAWRVFANDENPESLKYLAKNVEENHLQAKIELYNLECHEFLRRLLSFRKPVLMTQVILDLSTTGDRLLDALKGAFSNCSWPATQPLPMIHVYGYSDALDTEASFLHRISHRIGHRIEEIDIHRVWQNMESKKCIMYASFRLPKAVAFYLSTNHLLGMEIL